MSDIVRDAEIVATIAHAAVGQKRNDGITDYIVHPRRVVDILTYREHTPEMLAAAWMHDVVEDTEVTLDDLRLFFPVSVVQMVHELTKQEDMRRTRVNRKKSECERLALVINDSKTIKLADIIDNLGDLDHSLEFCDLFVKEKSDLLPSLEGGDEGLMSRAKKMIEVYNATMEDKQRTNS